MYASYVYTTCITDIIHSVASMVHVVTALCIYIYHRPHLCVYVVWYNSTQKQRGLPVHKTTPAKGQ